MSDYNLVYQGGHHSVFCNGEEHYKMVWRGDLNQYEQTDKYPCDCRLYIKDVEQA